jgi:hypothetical protein
MFDARTDADGEMGPGSVLERVLLPGLDTGTGSEGARTAKDNEPADPC